MNLRLPVFVIVIIVLVIVMLVIVIVHIVLVIVINVLWTILIKAPLILGDIVHGITCGELELTRQIHMEALRVVIFP